MAGGLKPWKASLKASCQVLAKPWAHLQAVLPLKDEQWAALALLGMLVQRDLTVRYKGSVLGNLWPVVHQLSMLLIYTYVFSIVLQVKLELKGGSSDSSLMFGLWLFAGLLPWLVFNGGLQQAASAVVRQPNLVKKVVFPLSLLPLVPVFSGFLENTFGLMILIAFVAFFQQTLHLTLLLLPLVWLPLLLLTTGLGYGAASLSVFVRDIPQTLVVVLNLWFYATPVIYPVSMIPDPLQQWVFWLNPVAAIAEMYRDIILIGEVTHWGEWAIATVLSSVIFGLGFGLYRKLKIAFADVL
ncbi:MAG: ABC transporter permease [Leptolyngbya sp. SIOISBB]|nr:ABC transporter permease [Leptolyngbya sp. SIOISBB]